MRKLFVSIGLIIGLPLCLFAQLQSPDDEGHNQVNSIKKLSKKAKYGAYLINQQYSFGTGKGLNKSPVVTATEKGNIEMVAVENKAPIGYMVPYNQFVQLKDYDFAIYYKNNFKSQKYQPQRVSLTDDAIYLDDSYGEVYGFTANESGQRAKFTYEYEYTDAKYLTRLFFHESFPITKKVIQFKVPS